MSRYAVKVLLDHYEGLVRDLHAIRTNSEQGENDHRLANALVFRIGATQSAILHFVPDSEPEFWTTQPRMD
jgi:hypothetical protein